MLDLVPWSFLIGLAPPALGHALRPTAGVISRRGSAAIGTPEGRRDERRLHVFDPGRST
jgi:hypothetical protein